MEQLCQLFLRISTSGHNLGWQVFLYQEVKGGGIRTRVLHVMRHKDNHYFFPPSSLLICFPSDRLSYWSFPNWWLFECSSNNLLTFWEHLCWCLSNAHLSQDSGMRKQKSLQIGVDWTYHYLCFYCTAYSWRQILWRPVIFFLVRARRRTFHKRDKIALNVMTLTLTIGLKKLVWRLKVSCHLHWL